MKKTCLSIATMLLLFSCQSEDSTNNTSTKVSKRACAYQEVLERQLKENPELATKMAQVEAFTENALQNPNQYRLVKVSSKN
jgi:hypothetical protein